METILIVAGSARMLVQAAKNAGLKPLVIDLFADLDTQGYAEDFRQINSLAEQDLAPAVDYFVEHYAVEHVIYGSGFECYLESLRYLNSRLIMLGNHPDVFAGQLDKQAFFSILDQLNIPHPGVVFSAPDYADDWLLKPMQGQGGFGIKRYHVGDNAKTPVYWQKFQAGAPHSVLFLANGQQAQVVGFNSQWSVRLSETEEFVFSGVINSTDLSDAHKAVITGWLKQLVPVFGLKGLNSLDFIHADDCSYVLEINPRPSASMQLYDQDLLTRHIQSCLGTQSCNSVTYSGAWKDYHSIGYQIVYAERDLIIPDHFEWPNWCMDLPKSGNMCRTGQPICSIIAHQKNSRSVAEQLLTKQQLIINKLERFDPHGIYSQR
ncbi:ATP-grasp domain-containing protein [Methylobacter sp.]|uniref:ATP-grasp domain-containing protein n=1 Tax=Methylobacter sp. TaxID=2051955 RepID=UPI0012051A7C|nr:ATP-grasp domain-containing protein [Methylobacter sp.]TAK61892.1 MAG: ATP-grasp domain-containing protein [Methylobacter sp.]